MKYGTGITPHETQKQCVYDKVNNWMGTVRFAIFQIDGVVERQLEKFLDITS